MNTLIVFFVTFVISIICFRIVFLYLQRRFINKIAAALKKELNREPTDKEVSDMVVYALTGSIVTEIPQCPPHKWGYDKNGNLICSKCQKTPTTET